MSEKESPDPDEDAEEQEIKDRNGQVSGAMTADVIRPAEFGKY